MHSSYFVLSMHLQMMDSRSTFPSLVETLAHAHHISHLEWRSSHVVVETLAYSHHVSCLELWSQSLTEVLGEVEM